MILVFLGAPGAGKGTQAALFSRSLAVPHISTGDMFREAVAKGTEMGLRAKGYMDRGELVPDEVVIGVVKERLSISDCNSGCIFDGFPRTVAQAEALDGALAQLGKQVDFAINIIVDEEEIVRRLSGRRTCKECGKIYHIEHSPPSKDELCDLCGGNLYLRDDDKEETIRNRLRVYYEKTSPLVEYYRNKGVLHDVGGKNSVEEVSEAIKRILENR